MFFCVQEGARCVVARNFEQVGEHLLHAFCLVMQEFGGTARVRWEILAVVPHDLLGHADRGQRRTQLV